MSFNPTKCTVIRVSPSKTKPVLPTHYQLHGHTLEVVEASKYLGVTITNDLSWDRHIDNVAAKGNRRRNLRVCTKQVRETFYLTIVRPTLECAAMVWDPITQTLIQTLENVQRKVARYVINDYTSRTPGCVTSMLTSLEWQTLEQRRRISRLVMMYKIQHQLVDIDRDLYLRPGDSRTRGQHRFFQERSNYDTLRNSFQRTAREWNHLPDTTVGASSIEEFRANQPCQPVGPCTHVNSFSCVIVKFLVVHSLGDSSCVCLACLVPRNLKQSATTPVLHWKTKKKKEYIFKINNLDFPCYYFWVHATVFKSNVNLACTFER